MSKISKITFHLCDLNADLIDQWKLYFGDHSNFTFHHGDIFKVYEDLKTSNQNIGLVSPANSFGELSGGIDLLYLHYFGYRLEEEIQNKIVKEKDGELIVGDAFIVDLPDYIKGYFIVAPTMRIPMNICGTVNVYLAFRAILIALKDSDITHVIVPGLGTGIGEVPPEVCAKQMYHAYSKILNPDKSILDLMVYHQEHLGLVNLTKISDLPSNHTVI